MTLCALGVLEERQILAVIAVEGFHDIREPGVVVWQTRSVPYSSARPIETTMNARGKATPTPVAIAGFTH
jgi:hypothetical protein